MKIITYYTINLFDVSCLVRLKKLHQYNNFILELILLIDCSN